MGRALALLVIAGGGCDSLFGVHVVSAIDATLVDVGPDSETCISVDVPTDADAEMISTPTSSMDQGHGLEAILNVGVAVQSQGLWRFVLPSRAPDARLEAIALHVPYAPSAVACGGSTACASCAGIDKSGPFDVTYARSDWDEATACFNRRATNMSWQAAGAAGAMDRSAIVGTASYVAGTELVVNLDPTAAATWISGDALSIILIPRAPAVIVAPQKQFSVTPSQMCNPGQQAAHLTVRICRG